MPRPGTMLSYQGRTWPTNRLHRHSGFVDVPHQTENAPFVERKRLRRLGRDHDLLRIGRRNQSVAAFRYFDGELPRRMASSVLTNKVAARGGEKCGPPASFAGVTLAE
jgi:hypothetical protein